MIHHSWRRRIHGSPAGANQDGRRLQEKIRRCRDGSPPLDAIPQVLLLEERKRVQGPAAHLTYDTRAGQLLLRLAELSHREIDLFKVIPAHDLQGTCPCGLNGGQQEPQHQADDCDYHECFDDRNGSAAWHGQTPRTTAGPRHFPTSDSPATAMMLPTTATMAPAMIPR